MLKNMLENEGVFCQIFNETGARMYNFYTQSNGGILLKVHQSDLDRARSILESNIRNDLLTEKFWNTETLTSLPQRKARVGLFIGLAILFIVLVFILFYYGR